MVSAQSHQGRTDNVDVAQEFQTVCYKMVEKFILKCAQRDDIKNTWRRKLKSRIGLQKDFLQVKIVGDRRGNRICPVQSNNFGAIKVKRGKGKLEPVLNQLFRVATCDLGSTQQQLDENQYILARVVSLQSKTKELSIELYRLQIDPQKIFEFEKCQEYPSDMVPIKHQSLALYPCMQADERPVMFDLFKSAIDHSQSPLSKIDNLFPVVVKDWKDIRYPIQFWRTGEACGGILAAVEWLISRHQQGHQLLVIDYNDPNQEQPGSPSFHYELLNQIFQGFRNENEGESAPALPVQTIDQIIHGDFNKLPFKSAILHLGVQCRPGVETFLAATSQPVQAQRFLSFDLAQIRKDDSSTEINDIMSKFKNNVQRIDAPFKDVFEMKEEFSIDIYDTVKSKTVDKDMHINPKEAEHICDFVQKQISTDFLILTPYSKQQWVIRKCLRERRLHHLQGKVKTFHQAEADDLKTEHVIVSLVVTSDKKKGRVGMYFHLPHHLTMALLHASKQVSLFGCLETFRKSEVYGSLQSIPESSSIERRCGSPPRTSLKFHKVETANKTS